jgi:DNA repair exonuclease SbcCD ATPase subunit|tara:strand:+ start:5496 stop:7199 length:1704 start_codon:yes stop_codon:yes gene_type:complete
MIHFKNIRWKNFLSTGNAWTEVDFQRSPSTLIIGENGSGKSTLLDALTYSLFNKPFRSVTVPQLINTINNKNMLVEINFSIGSRNYLIRRGMSPRKFDIEIDGEGVDKDANIRDMQKFLEENILKLNYKSFTQIVMLGSASFTPFMQLSLGARREIIEDLLDISIFSSMNTVLKQKYIQLENKSRIIEGEIEVAKQKAKVQEEYIKTLETDKQAKVDDILTQLGEEKLAVETNQETANDLHEEKEALGDVSKTKEQLDKYRDRFLRQIEQHEKQLAFFEHNDECPTCQQGIPHEHKNELSEKDKDKLIEIRSALKELETKYEEVSILVDKVIGIDEKIMEANNKIITHQRIVQRLQLELNDTETKVGNITEEKAKLKKLAKTTLSKVSEKSTLGEEEHYYNVVRAMLKDSGIKTKIIKEYLPIINKLVNKYLQAMDFFVQFDLDETFKETIKSRHRDKFSYASFSEGEKQRIDLALVFTWRTIAKMKNSASTNILLLDEVFDSSLDVNGTEYVMTLLNTIGEDTNVFVISHKGDQLFDKFRSVIRFEKRQNYSILENRKRENEMETQ